MGFILLVVLSPKETCQHLGTVGSVLQIYSQTLKEDTADDSAQTIQKKSHIIQHCSHSPARRPSMTALHHQAHLCLCRQHVHWNMSAVLTPTPLNTCGITLGVLFVPEWSTQQHWSQILAEKLEGISQQCVTEVVTGSDWVEVSGWCGFVCIFHILLRPHSTC